MRLRAATVAATICLALMASILPAAGAAVEPTGESSNTAILVLIPQDTESPPSYSEEILEGFTAIPELSIGLSSVTQGSYRREQALLDISQGARVSRSTYDPSEVPPVGLARMVGGSGSVEGWEAILERAETAPQTIEPGLLASSIPEGAAYVGDATKLQETVIPATDRLGYVSSLALADTSDTARRAIRQSHRYRLVVVATSPGRDGLRELEQIVELRRPGQLVIATQTPPLAPILPLLPIATAGLEGTSAGGLTSDTTNLPNLVAGIDIAPTILDHLGIPVPDEMTGKAFRSEGDRQPEELTPFRDRLDELGPRRTTAIAFVFVAWLLVYLAAGAFAGRERIAAPVRRIGGLSILWIPTVILVPAAIGNPTAEAEYALIAGLALVLGVISDRLLRWPRATLLPAAIGLGVITIDLALGSELITRSILGPNPGYGSRFYGIGNELKPALMVLLLAGLAAILSGRPKTSRNALIVLLSGLVLGVILGSGRLGAGVGAAIIVASATAVAAMMMLPGRWGWKRVVILCAAPVAGLILLAGLDLATAGGQGHYSGVLSGGGDGLLQDIQRRTTLAWQQLWKGNMPLVTLACLLAAAFAIRNRAMFRPWAGPIWPAALVGGLAGGLIGSVTEDSGPLLIVVATITLTGVCSYLLGRPEEAALPSDRKPRRQE
ncbi:MAG: hypothetical protein KDB48_02760 [Solirubrobacterales bacterium]|nr:hypothetical protein [Solirubrobacterales bacterium]HMT05659.1 hypothetical protein [Solirubrobacterales bacterium]